MKKYDNYLTQEETEELCRAYLDCRLSVLEETELRYVLSKLHYKSSLIDEVRMLMQLSAPTRISYSPKIPTKWVNIRFLVGIAASFLILFSIGFAFFYKSSAVGADSNAIYIAFANGHELSHTQSVEVVKSDMQRAEDFMRQMDMLENQEKAQYQNFINQIPSDL